ncbi:hypothetical protein B0J14DRAFT_693498 [Halenospora varia]|nr:hypothetical protein B0J14DRAFT_693498 [Halenospora varia]
MAVVASRHTQFASRSGPIWDKYTALGYVWGDVPYFKTTTENLSALQQMGAFTEGNPDIELLQAIRDTIFATRKLGFRYLWVDARIAQDPESKHAEIEKMGHIYSNASVTLIVCFGDNVTCGIPRVDKRRVGEQLDLRQDTT